MNILFKGIDFYTDADGNLNIMVPVTPVERPQMPFLSDEMYAWSLNEKIEESAFGDAYQAAIDTFFETLETAQVLDYLKTHSNL